MGHIELCVPVAHPWFASKKHPSARSTLLALSPRQLATILSYSAALVTHIDEEQRTQRLTDNSGTDIPTEQDATTLLASLTRGTILEYDHYRMLSQLYGEVFQAEWSADATLPRM